ncbi:sigma-54-dependent transcriptional regulator [Desulfoplanes formicivorans]|uniref:Fis family transcriptional regulator n=1 Tax=Desulfoplanes formicivorans TaxID=1592317 RepID=A0A194AI65_9BACT|nr:sigma-54 dependent transcriptional regulator [Desulfoplanes formicivorans]GAU08920.1 Fis family transcriptional regulator [Desulfoplanes formicivorans]
MGRILVIDPLQRHESFLRQHAGKDHELDYPESVDACFKALKNRGYDIVLICFDEQHAEDQKILQEVQSQLVHTPVIIFGTHLEAETIVNAVKKGVFDCIVLPTSGEKIRLVFSRAIEHRQLRDEIDYLRHDQGFVYDFNKIIAESAVMREVMATLKKFAATDATILMTGETGTGKSFLSGLVHFNSGRRTKSFITINCANIPETLLESELFGHERGAFTGADKVRVGRLEQGNGGTVFLDEIGEMVPSLQAKLLRVLEEKSFERLGGNRTIVSDVRIIAATNRELEDLIHHGSFRQDLYYRLNVLRIHLPPLRERKDCIVPLAQYMLDKIVRDLKKKIVGFAPDVLDAFLAYPWPGNLRQLKNVIERAAILEDTDHIRMQNIVLSEKNALGVTRMQHSSADVKQQESVPTLKDLEREVILDALEQNGWVQKKAAERLGVSPRALNYKIKKFGITHRSWPRHR